LLVAFVGTTFMTFDFFDLATVLAGAAAGLTAGAVVSGITVNSSKYKMIFDMPSIKGSINHRHVLNTYSLEEAS
jgi:hypothetical protein